MYVTSRCWGIKRQDSKGENDMTRYEQEQIITALRWVNDDLIDREKLIAYAEEHFQGNVPHVEALPTLQEYNLTKNPIAHINQEELEAVGSVEQRYKRIVVPYFGICAAAYALGLLTEWIPALVFAGIFMVIFPIITYMILSYSVKEAKDNAAVEFKERFQQYKDNVVAYAYWTYAKGEEDEEKHF